MRCTNARTYAVSNATNNAGATTGVAIVALLAVLGTAWGASAQEDEDSEVFSSVEAGASIFVRGDTDRTVVISPRASTSVTLADERTTVRGAYMADIWTSASIDIRTAASVRRPRQAGEGEGTPARSITEQRDQIDVSAQHEFDDVTIGASYYFSGEHDYWSHGFGLRSVQELFGGSTTFEESARFIHDTVGRAGDPNFSRPLESAGLRLVFTQILNPEAILQVVYDGTYRTGFQSSPYRFVGLGGDGQCAGTATLCIPEVHPNERVRSAFVLRARFAFGEAASAGLGYRFYIDDWGVSSHTATAQIAWIPARQQIITLRYRFYTQTAAGFYHSTYPELNPANPVRFVTRDRELSPTFSNRLAISYQGTARLTEDASMKLALAVGGTAFVYPDFVGLEEVYAVDATFSVTLEL